MGYKDLRGVTRSCSGCQGVTGGLQIVTMGYRGLQAVTEDQKVLRRVTNG